jgi:hypothetical protein
LENTISHMNTEPEMRRHTILRGYVNDMIGLESDIAHAIKGQSADENVRSSPNIAALTKALADSSATRLAELRKRSEELDGKLGANIKEALTATTGTLASLYGKVRKHPVSKMLRDDVTALNLAATSYGMLYTTALAFNEDKVAETALESLNQLPAQIMQITALLPEIVVEELAADDPALNPEAADIAAEAIDQAWVTGELSLPA